MQLDSDLSLHDLNRKLEGMEVSVREHVLAALHASSGDCADACQQLYSRLLDLCQTVRVLEEHARHDWTIDGMALLRVGYDASLQLQWILRDRASAPRYAKLFKDWQWIERIKLRHALHASEEDLAAVLMKRSRFREAQPAVDAEVMRVGAQFLTRRGEKALRAEGAKYLLSSKADYRRWWYPVLSLGMMARDLGQQDEYELWIRGANSSVHSSIWALGSGQSVGSAMDSKQHHVWLASQFSLRAANAIARHFDVSLDQLQKTVLKAATASIHTMPTRAQ